MKRKTFLSVLLLLLCGTMLRGADQDFALVLNGKGVCRFEIRKNSPADLYRAVNRFNGALKKITGVGLSYSSHIPKGRKITFSVQKLTDLRSADHYEITFPDKDTMLVKGTLASIQWALNDLIRSTTHAEWILPENCGLSYTEMKEVTLPRKKIVSKKYSWNLTRILGQRTSHWHLHARQGIRVDHDLTRHAFPSSKYGKNNTWPEAIMPVLNGKKITALPDPKEPRCYWQPCYSNPETAQIAIRNLLEYLKAHPDLPGLSLAVNDNAGYCECKKCMTLDKKKRYERSESYYTFVNAVVKAVASKYPEKFFSVLAYGATYLPPSFPLHPNVGVMLTIDIGSCVNPVMLKKHKEVIRAWSRKASVLGIWDYSWGYPYPMCRSYEPYHTDLLRFLYEHNGRFYCGESWTYDAHEGPKHYVIGRLLRDHSIDVKKVRQEWYERCVGKKAAPYLEAYFDVWNRYFTGAVTKTPYFRSATSVYMTYNDVSSVYALQKKDLAEAEKAMSSVVKYASTPQEKERAALMKKHWRMTELRLRMLGAGVYDCSGNVPSSAGAVELLKTVQSYPAIRKEYETLCRSLLEEKEIRPFYQSKAYIRQGATPLGQNFDLHISNQILAASAFSAEGSVKTLFEQISRDPAQSETIRSLCKVLGNPSGQKNLLTGGDAEKGILPNFEIHPQLRHGGRLSITDEFKAEGKKSFCVSVTGHDTLFWILGKGKPSTTYLATFKVFIPQPSAEGFIFAALYSEKSGRNQQWRNVVPVKLSGGVWQSFSVLTKTSATADSVRLRLYVKKFEKGDKVYFDDIKITEIR